VTRLLRTSVLAAAIVSVIACAPPQTASATTPGGALCTLGGLVSGVVGKVCTVASHAGRVLSAGKKLLGGHVGGALDALSGSTAGKALTATAGAVAIAAMVMGGARYLLRETSSVIGSTTRPNLQSSWFSASYWRMAAVSALLTLPFLFAAAIQSMIRSDLAMLVRATFGYLPLGLLAVAIAAPLTMLLLAGSDEMSSIVASASGHADASFLSKVSVLTGLSLTSGTAFVAFFVALLTAAATMVLWIELLIRAAAIYVIVLMLPLFFAALVWPARRIWAIRAVELLVALILSKFAIVAVLSLGGAALGHTILPGAAATLGGATLIMLATFSPWALLRLLPLHELAGAAAGGLRPHGQLPATDDRAHAATDRGEDLAAALPARMEAQRRVAPSDEQLPADRDYGATNGGPPREEGVSAGPGDATAGVSEVGSVSSETPAVTGSPAPTSDDDVARTNGHAPGQAPPMEWPFRPEDRNWRPPILGRQEIDSPQPLVLPDEAPVPDEPATAEDPDPLPPAQDRGEDHNPLPPAQDPGEDHDPLPPGEDQP
jgi:hypothetical protein